MTFSRDELLNFLQQPVPREVPEDLAKMAVSREDKNYLIAGIVFFFVACAWLRVLLLMPPDAVMYGGFVTLLITSASFLWMSHGVSRSVRRLLAEGQLAQGRIDRTKIIYRYRRHRLGVPSVLRYIIVSFQYDEIRPAIRFGPLTDDEWNYCQGWSKKETVVNVLFLPDEIDCTAPSFTENFRKRAASNEYAEFISIPGIFDSAKPHGRAALVDLWR